MPEKLMLGQNKRKALFGKGLLKVSDLTAKYKNPNIVAICNPSL